MALVGLGEGAVEQDVRFLSLIHIYALHRILGVKAALNLHVLKEEGNLVPPRENLAVVGCAEHHEAAKEMADRFVTLVKDRCHYLPMTKERYGRLKLVYIGSEATVIAGQKFKSNDDAVIQDIVEQLEARGFSVFHRAHG